MSDWQVWFRKPGDEWKYWGSGNTRRTAEVSAASCLSHNPDAEIRLTQEFIVR